jgi:hypothetical protein
MSTWWDTLSNWSVLEKARRVTLMKMNCLIHALTLTLMAIGGAQAPPSSVVPVTIENFVRAETDFYFSVRPRHAPSPRDEIPPLLIRLPRRRAAESMGAP